MKTFLVQVMLPSSGVARKTLKADNFEWCKNTVRLYTGESSEKRIVAEFNAHNVLCIWDTDSEVPEVKDA